MVCSDSPWLVQHQPVATLVSSYVLTATAASLCLVQATAHELCGFKLPAVSGVCQVQDH